ncbi:MAG TPA: TolC family protein [Candidatus Binatia bacterium]|nr:TolC family protein [Candidatus Binatia bacterium]
MRSHRFVLAVCLAVFFCGLEARGQTQPGAPQAPVRITLEDAVRLALAHNHALAAARTIIQQSQAQEITANLRPNLALVSDAQFLPVFNPDRFTADYVDQLAQFDMGVSYLFERGKKRQHRLQAAKDVTALTTSLVADNERTLTFQTASAFVAVLLAEANRDLSREDLKSFQSTVDISEARFKAGDISEGDYLKIKLQLLQFQTDVSQAELACVQSLVGLRGLLGYESVPLDYDVAGTLAYEPLKIAREEAQGLAADHRPDLRAAVQGVAAAHSQYELAVANGKMDFTGQVNYTHLIGLSTLSFFVNVELPTSNRNQGEIARTRSAISQAEELHRAAEETVQGDVASAYDGVKTNDRVVQLYRSGYLDESRLSREISEYAYKRGAASLLDFLDAERSYRATQLAYRQSVASYMLAVEQLREAVGSRNLP